MTIHAAARSSGAAQAGSGPGKGGHRRPVREGERGEEGEHDTERGREVQGRSPQLRAMASDGELSLP